MQSRFATTSTFEPVRRPLAALLLAATAAMGHAQAQSWRAKPISARHTLGD